MLALQNLSPSPTEIAAAAAVGAVIMGALWWLQHRKTNADWVDFGWALLIGIFAILCGVWGDGAAAPRWLAAGLGACWSARLSYHLLRRALRNHEDNRYRSLRELWGDRAPLHFVWFFQAQALLALGLALPFWLASGAPQPGLSTMHWIGIALFATGWITEAVADQQLAAFRADPPEDRTVCDVGLWRYSRHPNYFGEFVMWCGFAAVAWPAPYGPWALVATTLMFVLLYWVTGVPPAEKQSLRRRGDAYRAYQQRTNKFFPGKPLSRPGGPRP